MCSCIYKALSTRNMIPKRLEILRERSYVELACIQMAWRRIIGLEKSSRCDRIEERWENRDQNTILHYYFSWRAKCTCILEFVIATTAYQLW
jgi:hypothetical protein